MRTFKQIIMWFIWACMVPLAVIGFIGRLALSALIDGSETLDEAAFMWLES